MLSCTASYTHKYRNSSHSSLSKNCTERFPFPFRPTYTAPIRLQRRVTDLLSTPNILRAALSNFVVLALCASKKITKKVRALHIQATPLPLMNLYLQQLTKTSTLSTKISALSSPNLHPAIIFISGLISRISSLDI
jgi:hypothetical protein